MNHNRPLTEADHLRELLQKAEDRLQHKDSQLSRQWAIISGLRAGARELAATAKEQRAVIRSYKRNHDRQVQEMKRKVDRTVRRMVAVKCPTCNTMGRRAGTSSHRETPGKLGTELDQMVFRDPITGEHITLNGFQFTNAGKEAELHDPITP